MGLKEIVEESFSYSEVLRKLGNKSSSGQQIKKIKQKLSNMDENNLNNNPSNLIPLCPTHHQYWHSNFKYLIEKRVLAYIDEWKIRDMGKLG